MGFFKKLFSKEEEVKEDIFQPPILKCKYECEFCHDGIDTSFHKWTKQLGKYYHKACWNKAVNLAKEKNMI